MFAGSPTPEHYRPLAGELTFRFFMPVRKQFWWLGLNAHIGSHALPLATAARDFGEPAYRDLAYRQFEWIFGANPFGASLASGIGVRNPYPHSRYVGIIPGGIMNGICGDNGTTNPSWIRDSPKIGAPTNTGAPISATSSGRSPCSKRRSPAIESGARAWRSVRTGFAEDLAVFVQRRVPLDQFFV